MGEFLQLLVAITPKIDIKIALVYTTRIMDTGGKAAGAWR
jgi:hypothetical protein